MKCPKCSNHETAGDLEVRGDGTYRCLKCLTAFSLVLAGDQAVAKETFELVKNMLFNGTISGVDLRPGGNGIEHLFQIALEMIDSRNLISRGLSTLLTGEKEEDR